MDFLRVELHAPRRRLADLDDFYASRLGMERIAGAFGFRIGVSELVFQGAEGEPFYHFALLAPGDRFAEALIWARDRIELLPGGDVDEVVFDFDNWNALAFYFHDPAGNIVELIAHRGLGETGKTGPFDSSELLGISELGLVGEPTEIAGALEQLDIRLWDGALLPGRLAFLGERGTTFIAAPEARGCSRRAGLLKCTRFRPSPRGRQKARRVRLGTGFASSLRANLSGDSRVRGEMLNVKDVLKAFPSMRQQAEGSPGPGRSGRGRV